MNKFLVHFASWFLPECLFENEELYKNKNFDEREKIIDFNFDLMFYTTMFIIFILLIALLETNFNGTLYTLYFFIVVLILFPINALICIYRSFKNG